MNFDNEVYFLDFDTLLYITHACSGQHKFNNIIKLYKNERVIGQRNKQHLIGNVWEILVFCSRDIF